MICGLTVPAHEQRWQFVTSQVKSVFKYFLLVDAAQSYIHWNPWFSPTGEDTVPISVQGPILTFLNVIA